MGSDRGDSRRLDSERLQAIRQESRALRRTSQETIARARAARERARHGRSQREILQDSALARLLARQRTIAVIEQAKGIIMAQHGCGPEDAFDLLRRASQRTNVKVRELAAQIVEHVACRDNHSNVTPITLGTRRYQRSVTGDPPDDADKLRGRLTGTAT